VVVAVQSDLGQLGKTVVVDYLDGGRTIYGLLDTVDVAPFTRLRDSVDGLGASFVRNNAMTEVTGVLHPERAVGFRTCWEDPTPAMKRSAVAMP
jgi:hypothetical protein